MLSELWKTVEHPVCLDVVQTGEDGSTLKSSVPLAPPHSQGALRSWLQVSAPPTLSPLQPLPKQGAVLRLGDKSMPSPPTPHNQGHMHS